jgi:predicted ATPase
LRLISKSAERIIIIIGGPGTGKVLYRWIDSKVLLLSWNFQRSNLEAKKQGNEQLFLEKPLLFSELLLEGRKNTNAQNEPHDVVLLTRNSWCFGLYVHWDSYPASFDAVCREHIYSKIFILPPWEEIYTSDEARYENYEQAKLIQNHLIETYQGYGYNL